MLLTGTVVQDPWSVVRDGAVVVEGARIATVGDREDLLERYPDHERRAYDLVAPGLVGAHVHSVQSLGRGMADDVPLLDWLYDHVLPMEAALSAEELELSATLGYLECIESGTTTVVDHLSVAHADRAFEAAGELGIRGVLGKVLMDRQAPPGLLEDAADALAESERLVERYHGSHGDRLRYAVTPRFALTCSEDCLRGARMLADRHDGVRLHTHAAETRAEVAATEAETGRRPVEWLHEVGLTGEDVVLAHGVWTDGDERDVLAETSTHVVHCPSSNMKLASGVAPVVDYLDRGINVALGNDGPPCNNTLDPFTEMRGASLLQKVDRLEATAAPASVVFEMATRRGARAAGFDDVGALHEGWRADVIGLTTDVTRATPLPDVLGHFVFGAHGDDVRFTMVDGEVLYDDGELTVADADAVRRRAREVDLDLSVHREAARRVKPAAGER